MESREKKKGQAENRPGISTNLRQHGARTAQTSHRSRQKTPRHSLQTFRPGFRKRSGKGIMRPRVLFLCVADPLGYKVGQKAKMRHFSREIHPTVPTARHGPEGVSV